MENEQCSKIIENARNTPLQDFVGHWNDSDLYNLITEFFRKCCNLVNFIFN